MNGTLDPKEGHRFSDPIWDQRMQAMWITFTAIYLISGSYLSSTGQIQRWISSSFLTIAGLLVLALLCHTVVAKDGTASRKTLLVALTACLFFVQKSGDTFHDYNGVAFAVIFAAIILLLIWIRDTNPLRRSFQLKIISIMVATVIFSALGLISTFIDNYFLRASNLPWQTVCISPHVVIILSGIASFSAYDTLIYNRSNNYLSAKNAVRKNFYIFITLLVVGTCLIYSANAARLQLASFDWHLLSIAIIFFVLDIFVCAMTLRPTPFVYDKTNILPFVLALISSVMAIFFVAITHSFLEPLQSGSTVHQVMILSIYIYACPIVFCILAATSTSYLFGKICSSIYASAP